jgi:hypothetical protein
MTTHPFSLRQPQSDDPAMSPSSLVELRHRGSEERQRAMIRRSWVLASATSPTPEDDWGIATDETSIECDRRAA